jgi:Fe-S-cluster containining protein
MELKHFIPQEFCLICKLCCRFNQADTVWAPRGIKPISHEDYFICPRLNINTNRCRIYLKRPFDCRLYPFLLAVKNKKVYLALDSRCPYAGDRTKAGALKKYSRYLVDLFSQEGFQNYLLENPGLTGNYGQDIIFLAELPLARLENEIKSPRIKG